MRIACFYTVLLLWAILLMLVAFPMEMCSLFNDNIAYTLIQYAYDYYYIIVIAFILISFSMNLLFYILGKQENKENILNN